jgi:perosamine synthetase
MIPLTKPYFTPEDYEAMKRPMDSGWVAQGPEVEKFEQAFAECVGAKYAVATSSCTAAMHIALAALGIGKGDEVIVPSFSFVATAAAVEYTGAKPVFCDVDPRTYNIDPADLKRKLSRHTKAVMAVHLFGLSADINEIMRIAVRRDVAVIEDAACAAGSAIDGKRVGTFGAAGCYSFHARKIITTGEGGMLVAEKKPLYEKARRMRSHGASVQAYERHLSGGHAMAEYDELGYNYRMTDIQAALGLSQLEKLDAIIELRREKAAFYLERLAGIQGVLPPGSSPGALHTYQSFVITLHESLNRDLVGAELERRGVATRPGAHAIHLLGYYGKKYGFAPGACPVSARLHAQSMALPLFPQITESQMAEVMEQLQNVIIGK